MPEPRSAEARQPAVRASEPRLFLAVQYGARADDLPGPRHLRRWAKRALTCDARLVIRWVGEGEGRRLNAAYRARGYATNVLTFVYDGTVPLSGDLVLCAPVIRREAREQGKAFADHCAHLVVHGTLHLQGHDHDNDRAARRMEARETAILAELGIPDPYADPYRGRPEPARRRA